MYNTPVGFRGDSQDDDEPGQEGRRGLQVVKSERSPIEPGVFRLSRPVDKNDHVQGSEAAVVTLLMYGAYECPFCVEGNRVVKKIQAHFGGLLRFAFRHFPQTSVHPHSEAAAEVAEAAGEQNRFWEMHDTLFANHTRLDGEHLIGYAETMGLDMDQFQRSITGRVFSRRIRDDLISGIESGVKGTPTYFISGIKHLGPVQFETLVEAIEIRIASEETTS